MSEEKKPLTGAELRKFREDVQKEAVRYLDKIKIRQWAVEQAVQLANRAPIDGDLLKEMVKFFYDFTINKGECYE